MFKVIFNDVFLKLNLEYKNTVWSVVMCKLGIIIRTNCTAFAVVQCIVHAVYSESSILDSVG